MSEEQGCKKCKEKDRRSYQWLMVVLGFYIIFSSIYGSIILFGKIMNFFK